MNEQVNTPLEAPRKGKKVPPVVPGRDGFNQTFHEDHTQAPRESIFVFGSNLAGFHGAGAALAAYKYYGAELGVGEGMTGFAYAIPTKDAKIDFMNLEEVKPYIARFVEFTHINGGLNFFVTRVGCGLAGFLDEEIAPLFRDAINCSFAWEWAPYIK